MGKFIIKGLLAISVLGAFSFAPTALAQPYISISNTGSNSLTISVSNATFSQPIDLVYTLPGSSLPTVISNIGITYSGYWSGTLNLNEYGIVPGSQVYVRVGGQQSNTLTVGYGSGCTYNCGNYYGYGLSLSQTSIYLTVGQSQTVTANNYGSNIYIASNSNSSVVSASVSGSQINLYGLGNGSSTISVCASGATYACASLYVTVSGSVAGTGNSQVSIRDNYFSPQSITIPAGYSVTWRNDGSMPHTVTFDSPYSDSGTIYANGSYTKTFYTAGTYTYHCQFHTGMTGTVIVTGSGTGTGDVWFSPQSPTMYVGQSLAVSVYGGSGGSNYYISSNSNSNVLTASVSGNNLYLYGQNYGSATLVVCQSGYSSCGTLYVNVGGNYYGGNYYGGSISLSQTSLSLSPYQSAAVTIYGGGSYYVSSNSNPSAASASVSGSSLNIYAYASGSTSISVCQNYGGQCVTLQVNVGGNYYGGAYYGGEIRILNTTLPNMALGQYYNQQLNASGGVPPYTFSINSGSLPAGLNLSSSGFLSGVPQYAYTTNFSVRVTDNQGRSGATPLVIYGQGAGGGLYIGGGVLGASIYKNGQFIKEAGTIYIVYRGQKSGFVSMSVFSGFGFKLSNVVDVGSSGLSNTGFVISTSNASHPWGSWIKSGQTVYFVHESGLIPVPDWNTFLNNGGQANLIVNASLRDFQLPMLTPMGNNDSRLQ